MVVLSLEMYAVLTNSTEAKLDQADKMAERTTERYSHDDVFARVRGESMIEKDDKLLYLPIFEDDLADIADYISITNQVSH